MEEIYNSAIIDRETYINKTKHIQTLKQLINSKEKINNFIIQDVKRKAEYLDKMTNNIQNTILYNSSKNDDISKKDLTTKLINNIVAEEVCNHLLF